VSLTRGSLASIPAPATGESHEELVELGGVRIERILSGHVEAAQSYLQDDHEWVLVLRGSARLTVGDNPVELNAGDWVLLPAGVPHVLERVEPETEWLAVHVAR
jgi:cupin 2 domain-containing protein